MKQHVSNVVQSEQQHLYYTHKTDNTNNITLFSLYSFAMPAFLATLHFSGLLSFSFPVPFARTVINASFSSLDFNRLSRRLKIDAIVFPAWLTAFLNVHI